MSRSPARTDLTMKDSGDSEESPDASAGAAAAAAPAGATSRCRRSIEAFPWPVIASTFAVAASSYIGRSIRRSSRFDSLDTDKTEEMGTVLTESWQEITRKSSKNTPCWRGWRLVPQSVKSFDRINRIEKMKPKSTRQCRLLESCSSCKSCVFKVVLFSRQRRLLAS